jgi:hypothetical protein
MINQPTESYYLIAAIVAMATVITTLFLYIKHLVKSGKEHDKEMTGKLIAVITQTNSASQSSVRTFNSAIQSFDYSTKEFTHIMTDHTKVLDEVKVMLHGMNEKLSEIKYKK